MTRLILALAALALPLAGCAQFPVLDRKVEPSVMTAPYPALMPFGTLTPPPPPPPTTVADLTAQGASLQSRADAQNALP